jgi:16S rRNA (guanine527-N7)-methyltransferase
VSPPVDPAPPPELHSAAVRCFGDRLPIATQYAALLMTDGVVRGLIGPRESERLWDRHLLNCAVVADLIERDTRIIDVGSGAGLPGIVLAIARPDLTVVLVEPMARRAAFLLETISALDLDRTTVIRARAEESARGRDRLEPADVVTARAVAPLDRLAAWSLPLVVTGGRLLALKGESAADEVAAHRGAIVRAGGGEPVVRRCGEGVLDVPTTVVEIERIGRR